jgi:hypothetical protein
VAPAHQQFTPDHPAAIGRDLRLQIGQFMAPMAFFKSCSSARRSCIGLHGFFVEADPVAPKVFGAVHGGVRLTQQVFHAFGVLGKQGDADAGGAAVVVRLDVVWGSSAVRTALQPARLRVLHSHVGRHIVEQQHKLISAQARQGIALGAASSRSATCNSSASPGGPAHR